MHQEKDIGWPLAALGIAVKIPELNPSAPHLDKMIPHWSRGSFAASSRAFFRLPIIRLT